MEPFAQYAVAAAKEAFEDAGLDVKVPQSLVVQGFAVRRMLFMGFKR